MNEWVVAADDKGQYPEGMEGLKFMYGIWGDQCVNPEYDILKNDVPNFLGL